MGKAERLRWGREEAAGLGLCVGVVVLGEPKSRLWRWEIFPPVNFRVGVGVAGDLSVPRAAWWVLSVLWF